MFGFGKKAIWRKQLRRAVSIENCVKSGIFDHQVESNGYDAHNKKPSPSEGALFAGCAHYIVAWEIQKQLEMLKGYPNAAEKIQSMARQMLASDPDLEKLVIRLLYEIASLAEVLKDDSWAREYLHEHPRMMEVLTGARAKYPQLFSDVQETDFKALFDRFVRKYLPSMAEVTRNVFN